MAKFTNGHSTRLEDETEELNDLSRTVNFRVVLKDNREEKEREKLKSMSCNLHWFRHFSTIAKLRRAARSSVM